MFPQCLLVDFVEYEQGDTVSTLCMILCFQVFFPGIQIATKCWFPPLNLVWNKDSAEIPWIYMDV